MDKIFKDRPIDQPKRESFEEILSNLFERYEADLHWRSFEKKRSQEGL